MEHPLQPEDPLSQVVFIHDYLQLVFQDCAFTIYNRASYASGGTTLLQGTPGFCDALVGLIEQFARVDLSSGELSLHFSRGAVVSVANAGPSARGPEAWQFGWLGGPQLVEQNA
ncbi:hypothetical protein [Lysobacter xanthus]